MKQRHSAVEEGREAFRQGKLLGDNPYDISDNSHPDWTALYKRYTEWRHGWRDEQIGGDDPIPE